MTSAPNGPGCLCGCFHLAPLTGTEVAPEDGSAFRKDGDLPGESSQTIAPGPDRRDAQGGKEASKQMTDQSNVETSICFKGTRQLPLHPLNCIIIS